MKQDDIMYGRKDDETLEYSIEEVVEDFIEDSVVEIGESFDAIADRITWPLQIYEFTRMKAEKGIPRIASYVLDLVLESLDEEYADPEGDNTTPTPGMQAAAEAFARAIVAEYVPWSCERNGKVHEITREQAKEIVGD